MAKVRLALAQINPTVGAIEANCNQIYDACVAAAKAGANVVLLGEMSVTGYPIEDLATRESFVTAAENAVGLLADRLVQGGLSDLVVVVGHPALVAPEHRNGWAIAQNCATVVTGGHAVGRYAKHHLPNYSVFDEYRNFIPGNDLLCFEHEATLCAARVESTCVLTLQKTTT